MIIKRISLSEDVLTATAPSEIRQLFYNSDCEILCLGGFEGEKLLCYAVFSRRLSDEPRTVHMKYMFTIPKERNSGCCTKLLKDSEKYLKSHRIEYVFAKYILQAKHAVEYNDFMQNRGFLPLNLTGMLLHYHFDDLARPGAVQMTLENRDKLPKVVDIDTAGMDLVLPFLKKTGRSRSSLKEIGGVYSRFYIHKNKIEGAILATAIDEDTLYISSVYLSEMAKRKNMFFILFSECLDAARENLGDRMDIYIEVEDNSVYKGFLVVFNPPDKEYFIQEHMLCLELERS